MEKNNKMMIAEVTNITRQYCDLMEDGEHDVFSKKIDLLDNGELKNYTTLFCCKVEDKDRIFEEIESFRGKNKEDYRIDGSICHISTYLSEESFYYVSFDENEDCGVHANYNEKFSCIEDFFIRFLRFRNKLIDNKEVVKDDDVYQYFLSLKMGFDNRNKVGIIEKIKQKIRGRN